MKGQLYTLEVGIAILMILSVLIFLFMNPPSSPEYNIINYKMNAYTGLETLEQTGELRRYVADNNATAIEESLNLYIPGFLNWAVVIFNDTTNLTTKPFLEDVNDSVSVSYFLAGDFDDYQSRDIRVYIWGYKEKYTTSTTSTTTEPPTCSGTNQETCNEYLTEEFCNALDCCKYTIDGCDEKPCNEMSKGECEICSGCVWG